MTCHRWQLAAELVPDLKYLFPRAVRSLHPCHTAQRSVSDGKSLAVEEGSVHADIIIVKSGGHPTVLKWRTFVKHQFLKNLSVLIRK